MKTLFSVLYSKHIHVIIKLILTIWRCLAEQHAFPSFIILFMSRCYSTLTYAFFRAISDFT